MRGGRGGRGRTSSPRTPAVPPPPFPPGRTAIGSMVYTPRWTTRAERSVVFSSPVPGNSGVFFKRWVKSVSGARDVRTSDG